MRNSKLNKISRFFQISFLWETFFFRPWRRATTNRQRTKSRSILWTVYWRQKMFSFSFRTSSVRFDGTNFFVREISRFCRLGYVRVFLSIVSFYFMPTHPKLTIFCYLTSEFLDALDGHAARALGQSKKWISLFDKSIDREFFVEGTKFGAMFDMLIDRCSTMCLCFVLAMFYPSWALFFQLWAAIDVASHWLHLHAFVDCFHESTRRFFFISFRSTVKGSESHKKIDLSGNPVLRLYYTSRVNRTTDWNRWIFFNEFSFRKFFLQCAPETNFGFRWFIYFILAKARQVKSTKTNWKRKLFFCRFSVLTLGNSSIGLWRSILFLVTPIMVGKQIISLIHLYTAALDMASIDEADRANKSKQ